MIWVYNESAPSLLFSPPSRTVKYKTKLSVFSQNSSPGCLPPGIIILYLKSHFISPCILFQSQVAATVPTQQTKGTKYHILLNRGGRPCQNTVIWGFFILNKNSISRLSCWLPSNSRDLIWKHWPAVWFITASFFSWNYSLLSEQLLSCQYYLYLGSQTGRHVCPVRPPANNWAAHHSQVQSPAETWPDTGQHWPAGKQQQQERTWSKW